MKLVLDNVIKIKTDEPSIKRLKAMGYVEADAIQTQPDAKPDAIEDEPDITPDLSLIEYADLKALATKMGLEFAGNIKKVDLIDLIKASE